MRTFTAVVEKCSDTGLYVGFILDFLVLTRKPKP